MKTRKQSFSVQKGIWGQIFYIGFDRYIEREIPAKKFDDSFSSLSNVTIGCMDERVVVGINFAGSGILYDVSEAAEMIYKLILSGVDVQYISYHDGCGAAALSGKNQKDFTEELVAYMNKKYKLNLKTKYISFGDMRGGENHDATCTYVMFTEKPFNPATIIDEEGKHLLPVGFEVEGRFFPIENTLKELGISIQIAFGNHGFGKQFSEENPFVVVFVGDGGEKINVILEYLSSVGEFKQGKIRVEYIRDIPAL